MAEAQETTRAIPREVKGIVVSDKMDKTRVIQVSRTVIHPLYKKRFTRNRKLKIHDEKNQSKAGDVVLATSARPMSKTKHFRLSKIVERAEKELKS